MALYVGSQCVMDCLSPYTQDFVPHMVMVFMVDLVDMVDKVDIQDMVYMVDMVVDKMAAGNRL